MDLGTFWVELLCELPPPFPHTAILGVCGNGPSSEKCDDETGTPAMRLHRSKLHLIICRTLEVQVLYEMLIFEGVLKRVELSSKVTKKRHSHFPNR